MATMCEHGCTAEMAIRDIIADSSMPTAKWFRDVINSLSEKQAERFCKKLLAHTVRLALQSGLDKNRPVLVSIDKHKKPRHDDGNMTHLIYSKWDRGTKKFEAYATLQVVGEDKESGMNVILDGVKFTRDTENVEFMRRFVHIPDKYRISVNLMLMDREFYAVEIMRAVSEGRKYFLMPAVKKGGIPQAILDYHKGERDAVSKYVMKNSSGKSMEFTLLVVPAAKKKDEDEDGKKEEDGKKKRKRKKDKNAEILDKYVVFATNLPLHSALHAIKTLPEDYRRRWGIETGYRQITMSSPKTTSRSGPYRWLLFFVSMFMHNMWAIERFMARTRFEMVTLKAVVCATAKAALVACNSCRPRGNFGGPG